MDIIIGAGMTGLAYANFTSNKYLIIEADNEAGGYCKTIKQDGFTWDYSGHFFHFRHEWIKNHVKKNIRSKVYECKKESQIKYKKRLIDFPFQKNIHQLKKKEFIDCLVDLFSASPEERSSNFKEMLINKFGKSISDKFLIPYNQKLYACDINSLDVNAMGRFFPYANIEDIVLNFKKNKADEYNASFSYPVDGAVEYVNSLIENIDIEYLSLSEKVLNINVFSQTIKTSKRELKYDRLISTIPFPVLLSMCNIDYDDSIYSWNKVLVFNLGFNKKGLDTTNNWIYFPESKYSFYRVGYYDNIIPADRMSLYVEVSFNNDTIIDVKQTLQKVMADLRKAKIVNDEELISSHFVIMDPAYVHIKETSICDVRERKRFLETKNIYSIGRYGSWTYCSIEDNILEAFELVERLKSLT